MQIVWELNAVTLIAMVVQLVAGVTWITRTHDRAVRADDRSSQIAHDLEEHKEAYNERVRLTQEKLTDLSTMIASFRESVALSYIQREQMMHMDAMLKTMISHLEENLQRDIAGLRQKIMDATARIDRLIERYLPGSK